MSQEPYFKDASVLIFKNILGVNSRYLELLSRSKHWNEQVHKDSMGTTVQTLTIKRANGILIPFPPEEEQRRIVKKVNELMAVCDQLKARLNEVGKTRRQMADAVVEHTIH